MDDLSLLMENIELRRMIEMIEEGRINMCLILEHVLEEQVVEGSTPLIVL